MKNRISLGAVHTQDLYRIGGQSGERERAVI